MRAMKSTRFGYVFFSVCLCAVLYAPAAAQTTGTATIGTVHGMVPGQVARFSVVNTLPPQTCTVEVVVVDLSGNVLLDQRLIVPPGQAKQVDFAGQTSLAATTTPSTTVISSAASSLPTIATPTATAQPTPVNGFSRTEFRGVCRAADVQSSLRCTMSLEIFDQTTGATTVFQPSDACRILNAQLLPSG